MNDTNYKKMSKKEAFSIIGLHPKDDSTYFLANLVIKIVENKLRITKISGRVFSEPEDTYETERPFIFTHNGVDYILKVEDSELNVYEKRQFI